MWSFMANQEVGTVTARLREAAAERDALVAEQLVAPAFDTCSKAQQVDLLCMV